MRDRLRSVDASGRTLRTESGVDLTYGALLLATGARANPALPGALTYGGPESNRRLAELLREIRHGEVERVAFVVPEDTDWPLPLYELALLTEARAETGGRLEISLVTAEHAPLAMFGERASASIAHLLESAGIEVSTAAIASRANESGLLLENGDTIARRPGRHPAPVRCSIDPRHPAGARRVHRHRPVHEGRGRGAGLGSR